MNYEWLDLSYYNYYIENIYKVQLQLPNTTSIFVIAKFYILLIECKLFCLLIEYGLLCSTFFLYEKHVF